MESNVWVFPTRYRGRTALPMVVQPPFPRPRAAPRIVLMSANDAICGCRTRCVRSRGVRKGAPHSEQVEGGGSFWVASWGSSGWPPEAAIPRAAAGAGCRQRRQTGYAVARPRSATMVTASPTAARPHPIQPVGIPAGPFQSDHIQSDHAQSDRAQSDRAQSNQAGRARDHMPSIAPPVSAEGDGSAEPEAVLPIPVTLRVDRQKSSRQPRANRAHDRGRRCGNHGRSADPTPWSP